MTGSGSTNTSCQKPGISRLDRAALRLNAPSRFYPVKDEPFVRVQNKIRECEEGLIGGRRKSPYIMIKNTNLVDRADYSSTHSTFCRDPPSWREGLARTTHRIMGIGRFYGKTGRNLAAG